MWSKFWWPWLNCLFSFPGGRYEFTSSGQLYIRHVTQHDNMQRFKCHAMHRITKVKKYSPAARLQIHGEDTLVFQKLKNVEFPLIAINWNFSNLSHLIDLESFFEQRIFFQYEHFSSFITITYPFTF